MKEDWLNVRMLVGKALKRWYLFAIILPLFLGLNYFYLKNAPPKYQASALLLIKDEDKSGKPIEEAVFSELGFDTKKKSIENERYILRSSPLMKEVVENLNLQYRYFAVDGLKKRDIHNYSPVQVLAWEPKEKWSYIQAELYFGQSSSYRLEFDADEFPELGDKNIYKGEFGKQLNLPMGKLTITRTTIETSHDKITLLVLPVNDAVSQFIEELEVEPLGGEESSTILSLNIKDEVPDRAVAVLSELMKVYNQESINDKNLSYENSLALINERINMITEELSAVEINVESYKRQFGMVELSSEGNMLLQELAKYNNTISGSDAQLEILKSIEDYLIKNRQSFEFVPTNLTLTNVTLTTQLQSLNELLKHREGLRVRSGPAHPEVISTEKQIQNLRETIIDNIQSMKSDLQITRNSNENLRGDLENRMRSLPRHERELVEIERRKGIKENLYLYLLQKREESAISMAVTVATGKVVEPAASSGPISPKKSQLWLIAGFLGLAIPAGLVFLIEGMNDKLEVTDDIQKSTSVPVVGMLAYSKKNGAIVVKEKSRSVEAEMFRLLRANLAYINPGKDLKTILITSSISGEGKSYVALNLGVTQALTGKKVMLLELDLRKPKQEEYTASKNKNNENSKGVVDYLVNYDITIDEIINKSGLHPNLDLIKCGTRPPNPSELILSERLRDLIQQLKVEYDFIIIDAPPVGLVADALQMKDITEATMYVVRMGVTRKAHLQIIKDIAQKDKLPKPFIVVNDVKFSDLNGYGYSNTYGYAYASANGYYEQED